MASSIYGCFKPVDCKREGYNCVAENAPHNRFGSDKRDPPLAKRAPPRENESVNADTVVNVASVPHRSLFRYPGGKTWLVPHVRRWLASLPYRPREFAEPFAGGAIVGLSALFDGYVDHLTLVELDEDVSAVWRAVTDGSGRKLAERIVSFTVNAESVRAVLSTKPTTVLDRAFVTIVKNRVQRGGIMAAGAGLLKEGENGRGLTSRWYPSTLAKRIDDLVRVGDRIHFIQGDGVDFIYYNAHRAETVFFIDPPYTVAGRRLYRHSEVDHERLFNVAAHIKCDFLMTYDDTHEIRTLAEKAGFAMERVAMKNTHHEVMRELLIGRDLSWVHQHPRRLPEQAPPQKRVSQESCPQTILSWEQSQQ
jgi:DNA adenine methylase